jgi:hypothetical protein
MIDEGDCGAVGGMQIEYWQGKPKYSEKTCPSAPLSTTKSHMTRHGLEPEPPMWETSDNRLSYGWACMFIITLCTWLIKHYAMKAYGRENVLIHIFLISALVGGEWSASRPGRFTPGERAPGTHWIGRWLGPTDGLDDVEERKFCLWWDSNSETSVVQPVASRSTDYIIPVHR